jgi:hypothetical protein
MVPLRPPFSKASSSRKLTRKFAYGGQTGRRPLFETQIVYYKLMDRDPSCSGDRKLWDQRPISGHRQQVTSKWKISGTTGVHGEGHGIKR